MPDLFFEILKVFLKIVVGLDEEDIQLLLKQYNSNSDTYELSPEIYTVRNFSEAIYTMGDHEKTLQIEFDDISMKTNFNLGRFGETFGALRFDEKYFSLLSWDLHHIGIKNILMPSMLIVRV